MNKELLGKIDSYLAENHDKILEDLKTLVRIPSISGEPQGDYPFGTQCANVLDTALGLAEGYGLHAQNHSYYYGTATLGEGDKTIGIFSHLDVVPEGNGWIYDPYDPIEKDGYLIGRGVADNKGAAVAGMHVMNFFRTCNLPLRSKISLFFGCSEETGMQDIERYVAEQPMPDFSIVPDTDFPVCHGEKGILEADIDCNRKFTVVKNFCGGLVSNMVPDCATVELPASDALLAAINKAAQAVESLEVANDGEVITVTAHGVAAHASRPKGSVNAIGKLAGLLANISEIGENDRSIMQFVADTLSDNYGEQIGIAFEDEPSGKLTCICGVCSTNNNVLHLNFNIRYPVTHKGNICVDTMRNYFEKNNWAMTHYHDSHPAYLPKDDPKVLELCRIYGEITGKDSRPYVMGGGTYSRHLESAIGFGMESVEPMPFPSGHGGVHQPDEAFKIAHIMEAIKIYIISMLEIDELLHK